VNLVSGLGKEHFKKHTALELNTDYVNISSKTNIMLKDKILDTIANAETARQHINNARE